MAEYQNQNITQISIESGAIKFDGKTIWDIEENTILKYDDSFFYKTNDPKLDIVKFKKDILLKNNINKIFILSDHLQNDLALMDNFLESEHFFSWFTLIHRPDKSSNKTLHKSSKEIKILKSERIDPDHSSFLTKSWKNDYINKTLKDYCPKLKDHQITAHLSHLKKGNHSLYFSDKKLYAHSSFKQYTHPIFKQTATAVHQWIDNNAPKDCRKLVHNTFFNEINSSNEKIFCGIAQNNKKSLNHFLRNGFSPLYLTIKLIDSY